MQIHEITEGFWKNVGSGFVQGLTGIDAIRKTPLDSLGAQAPQLGQSPANKTNPPQGTIFLIDIGGMEYFKNYLGQWFEKSDPAQRYSASAALQIKDPQKTATLEKQLPQAKTIYVKPESPGGNVVFVPDPTGRIAKLAAKRQKVKAT